MEEECGEELNVFKINIIRYGNIVKGSSLGGHRPLLETWLWRTRRAVAHMTAPIIGEKIKSGPKILKIDAEMTKYQSKVLLT